MRKRGRRQKCNGQGFQEVLYNVVIGPKPWPWFLRFTTYRNICRSLGQFIRDKAESFYRFRRICFFLLLCLSPILILVINFDGSGDPRLDLEALTIHAFDLNWDNTSELAPWVVNGNFTVVSQIRNPSGMSGFRHRYLSTRFSAFYLGALLGQSEPMPRFTQGYKSARNVSADVIIRDQRISQTTGSSLQGDMQNGGAVWFTIRVDSYVKVKRLAWQHPKWFNLTCFGKASMPNSTSHQGGHLIRKICGS